MTVVHWDGPETDETGWRRWRATVPAGSRLCCEGIGGEWELLWAGEPVAEGTSAFERVAVLVPGIRGGSDDVEVELRARPLDERLSARHPRGRWRTTLVAEQGVRWYRTPMLGLAPFLGDVPAPLGPYRRTSVERADSPRVVELAVDTDHDGVDGLLRLGALVAPVPDAPVTCTVAATEVQVTCSVEGDGLRVDIDAQVPGVAPWWPHVLGEPVLHELRLTAGDEVLLDTRVGFRRLEVDLVADADGAGVCFRVGGRELHARGAVWSPLDPEGLRPSKVELRDALRRARRGGAVMLRVVGTTVYEEPAFWELAAEEGLLVWQDLMVANVDVPVELHSALEAEVRDLLRDVAGSPSLAVLSGGSEVRQQAEMSAVPLGSTGVEALDVVVPAELERLRPGTPYVPSTPWSPDGHGPAIRTGAGVSHYFGVGGYRRPLADARTADVRFAAESLAFAVPPLPSRVDTLFSGASAAGHRPAWKAGVPRDRLASWDFEDVRDHYVRELYGVEPSAIRAVDPERHLALGSAAVAEVMEEVLGWWRSPRSRCAGGLVLTARDLVPGAGWGMTDSDGVPKASWFAAAHRWARRALWIDDRGLDGLWVELHHDECPEALPAGILHIGCVGPTGAVSHTGSLEVSGAGPWSVDEVLGAVYDPGYVLRFGPAVTACLDLRWEPADGGEPVELVWTPRPSVATFPPVPGSPVAVLSGDTETGWVVTVEATAPVRHVVVDSPGHAPSDSWFHLAPGRPVRVGLEPLGEPANRRPRVRVMAEGHPDVPVRSDRPDPARVRP